MARLSFITIAILLLPFTANSAWFPRENHDTDNQGVSKGSNEAADRGNWDEQHPSKPDDGRDRESDRNSDKSKESKEDDKICSQRPYSTLLPLSNYAAALDYCYSKVSPASCTSTVHATTGIVVTKIIPVTITTITGVSTSTIFSNTSTLTSYTTTVEQVSATATLTATNYTSTTTATEYTGTSTSTIFNATSTVTSFTSIQTITLTTATIPVTLNISTYTSYETTFTTVTSNFTSQVPVTNDVFNKRALMTGKRARANIPVSNSTTSSVSTPSSNSILDNLLSRLTAMDRPERATACSCLQKSACRTVTSLATTTSSLAINNTVATGILSLTTVYAQANKTVLDATTTTRFVNATNTVSLVSTATLSTITTLTTYAVSTRIVYSNSTIISQVAFTSAVNATATTTSTITSTLTSSVPIATETVVTNQTYHRVFGPLRNSYAATAGETYSGHSWSPSQTFQQSVEICASDCTNTLGCIAFTTTVFGSCNPGSSQPVRGTLGCVLRKNPIDINQASEQPTGPDGCSLVFDTSGYDLVK